MTTPITIIIADDHPIFRRGVREVIESDPQMQVLEEAGDGKRALQLIETLNPVVAILDVHMPKCGGLEVARAALGKKLPVKLIMLTMHDDLVFLNEAMDAGVSGYVLKENAANDLLDAIRAVAEGRRYISPIISEQLLRRRQPADAVLNPKPGLEQLTPAERRVLKLIAEDRTSKEIADDLGISVRTVDTHRQNISVKLGLHGSHSLLKFAFDNKSRLSDL